jgi:hypothetical protein
VGWKFGVICTTSERVRWKREINVHSSMPTTPKNILFSRMCSYIL